MSSTPSTDTDADADDSTAAQPRAADGRFQSPADEDETDAAAADAEADGFRPADQSLEDAPVVTRPAWRRQFDTAHICSPCREGFDSADALRDHWDDDHW